MNIFQHSRFKIFNESQHPLKHDLSGLAFTSNMLPGISTLVGALDYIIAYMYPNYIGTFADPASLPVTSNPNDYAVVTDDGDGKSAGYVWIVLENTGQWMKKYDVDWSTEAVLAETINRTSYMYVHKYGLDDKDATGAALTGANAGQHVYGGASAGAHLTLHANSADADTTGFIQLADSIRPTANDTFSLGTTGARFSNFFTTLATVGTLVLAGGSITDTSGSIDFNNENLTTTGVITGASGKFSGSLEIGPFAGNALILGAGSITDESGAISFGDENLSTTGVLSADVGQFETGAVIGPAAGDALLLGPGSITDESGTINFGTTNLIGSGTVDFGDAIFTAVEVDNLLLSDNTLSSTDVNGNVNLLANGTGVIDAQSAMTTLGITTTGTIGVTGSITVDNLSLDANTLASTNANGNIILDPNGSGLLEFGAAVFPTTDSAWDLGKTGNVWNKLWIDGAIGGATEILLTDLLTLRSVTYRDAGRSQAVQAGDTIFWSGTQWLASVPDSEITHNSLSGLTTGDAGHTQFMLLAGRAGGQALVGGTAASETLTLESTAHATKGTVQTKNDFVPTTTASFSVTWSGTDLGDATHSFRDLYTKGVMKGLRLENYTSGTLPAASGSAPGRLVFSTDNKSIYADIGGSWVIVGGGGGGGSIQWVEDVDAPETLIENSNRVYSYQDADTQSVYALIRIPNSYASGSPIRLRTTFYSADTSGTALMIAQSTLVRTGTDAISSTTNQRTTTNAAVTLSGGTANIPQALVLDITDTSGQVNGIAVSAGDLLKVRLYRNTATDTATGAVKVPVYGTEITFT